MTLWEFHACVDGFMRFHGAEEKAPSPTIDDHKRLLERFNLNG